MHFEAYRGIQQEGAFWHHNAEKGGTNIGYIILTILATVLIWGERGRPIRSSTLKMVKNYIETDWKSMLNGRAIHGYIYGRWTGAYIRTLIYKVFPHLKDKGWKLLTDSYHSKVLTHEQAQAIITLDHDIPLQDLEQVVPYPMARNIMLQGPPDVAIFECGCRHASSNPCQPTQVCMVVGQPLVDFIAEHQPKITRKISKEEALRILEEEHLRGHLHSAWFKDAILDRFYAICNCCECCCGGIRAMNAYGAPMMVSSGYIAQVDEEACQACGKCEKVCIFNAISMNGTSIIDREVCMGCGVCAGQCENDALTLIRDESKGLPLDMQLLGVS